jgi:hypothetical protein
MTIRLTLDSMHVKEEAPRYRRLTSNAARGLYVPQDVQMAAKNTYAISRRSNSESLDRVVTSLLIMDLTVDFI